MKSIYEPAQWNAPDHRRRRRCGIRIIRRWINL